MILPLTRTMQFRDSNLEAAQLLNPPDGFRRRAGGRGRRGAGACGPASRSKPARETAQINRGVAIDLVAEMLEQVRSGKPLHTLDVELAVAAADRCASPGPVGRWMQKLEQQNPEARQVLGVARITGGAPPAKVLQQGDLVLAIDGATVTSFRDVERAVVDQARGRR